MTTATSEQKLQGDASTAYRSLKGQHLKVPKFNDLANGWPVQPNKHLVDLRLYVDAVLDEYMASTLHPKKLAALKRSDFGLLFAFWYPTADWARLEFITIYTLWIFLWDDEIDESDTETSKNEELTAEYCARSLQYIHQHLDLGREVAADYDLAESSSDEEWAPPRVMQMFRVAAEVLKKKATYEQRRCFFDTLSSFMSQVQVEHACRMRGLMPRTEDYIEMRLGTVGCAPQIALAEYMLDMKLPHDIMHSQAMDDLWRQTVVLCYILNDVYSARKEMAQGSLLNIVPVVWRNEASSLDDASDRIDRLKQDAVDRFNDAESTLANMAKYDSQLALDVASYVQWCKEFTTGVLVWSQVSARYGQLKSVPQDDDFYHVQL